MTDTRKISPTLTQRISALVVRAHPDPTVLPDEDIAVLKSILRGESQPEFPVNRRRALEALARSDASTETASILADALGEADTPVEFRMAIAGFMRNMPPASVEPPLIAALATEDERLRRRVVQSLGQLGGEPSDTALAALPETEETATARLLIALRRGVHNGALAPALGSGIRKFSAEPLSETEARSMVDALGGTALGIPLAPQGAVAFRCDATRNAVFLTSDSDPERPAVLAVVASVAEGESAASLRYLVLVAPAEDGLEVALVTPSGRTDYVGTGEVLKDALRFRLRDVAGAQVPLSAVASIAGGRIDLSLEIPEQQDRAARRVGTPLPILTENRARAKGKSTRSLQ